VAFPFKLNDGQHVVEVSGGAMIPGKEQIEGSASDWIGIQNFVSLRNDSGQIVFVSPEIPLVQLGDINLGKFFRVKYLTPDPSPTGEGRLGYPVSGCVFSWVLNNYWTTNFLASQEGELKWSYQITSMADPSNSIATRFGMENRVPFLYRVFPASSKPDSVFIPRSFFANTANNLVLVAAHPSSNGTGIILQLRETTGNPDSIPVDDVPLSSETLSMATRAKMISEVNVLAEPLKLIWNRETGISPGYHPVWLRFRPYETKFLLLTL